MDERYDAEALRRARAAAAPGEKVLWAGRPGQPWLPDWDVVMHAGVAVVVYGLTALHFREDLAQLMDRPASLAALVVLTVLAPGLGRLGVAVWWWRRRAAETYAVTERRVLILAPNGAVRHAVGLGRVDVFRRQERTLWLADLDEVLARGRKRLDGGMFLMNEAPRLERLADPEGVFATILRAARRRSDQGSDQPGTLSSTAPRGSASKARTTVSRPRAGR